MLSSDSYRMISEVRYREGGLRCNVELAGRNLLCSALSFLYFSPFLYPVTHPDF